MAKKDQKRLQIIMALERRELAAWEAASALGISTRQLSTLRARVRAQGPGGVIHGNRGHRPSNACTPDLEAQVVELWKTKYAGFNQVFFTEDLEREEGILLSRSTVRRMLAKNGISATKPQKRSRHRRHRVRRAQQGSMVQMDASTHNWLEGRGPRITLVGGIDDATGHAWATFRMSEDTEGYFRLIAQILQEFGAPLALYLDRTTIALNRTQRTTANIESGILTTPTQMTKLLKDLDIALIQARSPQAKGRIERLWRTLQDRLVCELRAKNVHTINGAELVLQKYLAIHNRHFTRPAVNPEPAWRPLAVGTAIADLVCWRYPRVVANDNTVSVEGTKLQLEFAPANPGWARRRVEVCRRLDGSWFARSLGLTVPATIIQPITQGAQAA